MATKAVQTEDIAWALKDVLDEKLPEALLRVQTERTREVYDLVVPPNGVELGFRYNALQAPPEDYPRVAVIAAPRRDDANQNGQRVTIVTHSVLVEWQVYRPTFTEATIVSWRYGEAVMLVIRENGPYAGFDPRSIAPQIDEGVAMPVRLGLTADPYTGFIAGGTAIIDMDGRYVA